ncbi:MAG: energy transducer TonB, partial [Acidobacteria bacterium]
VLSGQASLAHAAVDAVRQWKYKPYFLNGEPVEIQTQIAVNFKLPN